MRAAPVRGVQLPPLPTREVESVGAPGESSGKFALRIVFSGDDPLFHSLAHAEIERQTAADTEEEICITGARASSRTSLQGCPSGCRCRTSCGPAASRCCERKTERQEAVCSRELILASSQ